MSERLIVICAAVLLVAVRPVIAQSPENLRMRELRAKYDSIWPLLVAAESTHSALARAASNAEAAKKAEKLDTAFVGPIIVIARPAFIDEAREYIADIWQDYEVSARGAEGKLNGITIMIESNQPVPMFRTMAQRPRHMLLQLPSLLALQARRAYGTRAIGTQLNAAAPPLIRVWLKGAPLSWEDDKASAYRELAVSRSQAAALCFRQNAQSCVDALALTPTDSLWSNWYSAAQLHEFARESSNWPTGRTPDWNACIRLKRVESCAAFLHASRVVPAPLSEGTRAAFLQYALERGGEGSLARLLDSKADVAHAIEAAAGQPIEPLVASWRSEVQKARPEMHAGVTRSRLAIVFWLLLCAGLAMRSTRWRIA